VVAGPICIKAVGRFVNEEDVDSILTMRQTCMDGGCWLLLLLGLWQQLGQGCPNVGRSVPCAVTNSLFDPLVPCAVTNSLFDPLMPRCKGEGVMDCDQPCAV